MSVWSLDQINAVRRMYARVEVDVREKDREGFREAVHRGAAKEIKAMAQSWAIEPDRRDVHLVREEPQPERAVVIETWAWMPDVRTVRIMGGHRDGEEWEVQDVDQPIRFVHYSAASSYSDADAEPEAMAPTSDVMLTMTGWNEDDRVWIFGQQ